MVAGEEVDGQAALRAEGERLAMFATILEQKFGDRAVATAEEQARLTQSVGDPVCAIWTMLSGILEQRSIVRQGAEIAGHKSQS